ncbi:MAG: PD-(D/E)XK nuclease family protein [Elusimicrobiota bacterium]
MPGGLKVVCGPFEALEPAFVAKLRAIRPGPGDAPVLVVAPSRVMADRLERLLVVESGVSLIGVHFHTFHSLAAAVVAEGGFPEGRLLSDPVFHDAVVDRLLDSASSLGISKDIRPRALASAVRASLRDLIDAGAAPEQVAEHFGSNLLKDSEEAARLNGLLALLAAYEKELARLGVVPPSAVVRRAAELAGSSSWLSGFGAILYYGFYDLTGLQLDFFEAVTGAHASTLYFPYRKGHPAFRFNDEFFEQKLSGYVVESLDPPGGASTALGPALDAVFKPEAAAWAVDRAQVKVISASGERDEAWAAAKEVLRLADRGVAHDEIAVIARTLEPYRVPLAQAFASEYIPLDLACEEPMLRHPAAKAVLNLLTLRARDFPARTVEDLAGSPYFASQGSRGAARWRRLIDALGIRAGWLQWRGKLEPRVGGDVELRPQRVREGLPGELVPAEDARALWNFVSDLNERLGAPAVPWSKRSLQARAIIDEHLRLPPDASRAESEAWGAVSTALEELAVFDALGSSCTWDDFLDAFERKLTRAVRDAGNGNLGVRALDAMDARGHRFRSVIVLGLKEKIFPRQVLEDPLLRDAARAALRHPAGYWIARKTAGHEEERLLFYLTVASAKESLALIYPRSDEEGKACVASTYLRELCRAASLPAPGDDDAVRVPRQPAARLAQTPVELLTPREAALSTILDGGIPDPGLWAGGRDAGFLTAALARVEELNALGAPGAHDGLTKPLVPESQAWKARGFSPTALDLYAQCPFRFFAARVLGLAEREEASQSGEVSAQVRGLVYHAVLERFYSGLGEGVWQGTLDWRPVFEAASETVFAVYDWRALGVYPLLWEAVRRDMNEHLRGFVAWDFERLRTSGMRPRLYEARLKGAPPEGAPGGVPWKGIADRIDAEERGRSFRVADYKTRAGARSKHLAKRAAAGDIHQLPFYAELAGAALGPGWRFAGAELLFLEVASGEERVSLISAEEWALARGPFLTMLAQRVEAMASGRFPMRPDDGQRGHCSWCEFPTVCRKSHGPSRARAVRASVPGEAA